MRLKQSSFAGGVVSPQILGRSDQQAYASGLRTCLNAWITRYGTVENRPGTAFCGTVKDSTQKLRIVPFTPATGVSFLLEFGANYVRPWKQGARISVVGAAAYSAGTTYAIGDLVTYGGSVYWSKVATNLAHQPDISPTQWYLQVGGLLELVTPIPQAALAVMQYVQQNDLMTLTAQTFAPQQIRHYSDTRWDIIAFTQSTGIAAPTGLNAVALHGAAASPGIPGSAGATGGLATGSAGDRYQVSAYTATTQGAATNLFGNGNNIANGAFPITVSWSAATGSPIGYAVYKTPQFSSVSGLLAIVAGTSFIDDASISRAPPIGGAPATAGGGTTYTYVVTAIDALGNESFASAQVSCDSGGPTGALPNVVSWAAVTGAVKYNVYSIVAGVPGFIGQQPASPFNDIGYTPDTSKQPPAAISLFSTPSDYPAVCGYYQQRILFANTINQPQTVFMSKVGNYNSFTVGTPVLDTDAVSFTIAGKEVTDIRAAVDLGKLILHTSNGEYVVTGNAAGIITPSSVGGTSTGSSGSQLVAPVVIGNTDLFVQQGATRINDLKYEVQAFTYTGKDLTKRAADLFRGRSVIEMAWQKVPHSIVWTVLDNGTMLGLTYVPDEELLAWHPHTSTNGSFENVAVVTESSQYATYVVVKRTINGVTQRSIERLASRECLDSVLFTDSVFVDAALTYDGRNAGATTMTVTGGTSWESTETLTITASVAVFSAADVGNQIVLQQIDVATNLVTDQVSFDIIGYTGTTIVTARAQRTVPTWARAVALLTWGRAVKSFSGIGHLEGQSLTVLADGNIAADALDPLFATVTVSGGAFALARPALVVTAGLPVDTQVQTLPVENAVGESISDRRVTVRECTPTFYASRGGKYGQDSAHLNTWKQPTNPPANAQTWGYPQPAYTGPVRIPISGTPQLTGQVFIRHTEPTPFAMSAILIAGEIGN